MSDKEVLNANFSGVISLGDLEINCAVLPNGERVLSQADFLRSIGRSRSPKAGRGILSTLNTLPFFLQAKALEPFIDEELAASTNPVFYTVGDANREQVGYKAELLPKVCEVYLKLRDSSLLTDGKVPKTHAHIIKACDALMRGLAYTGIVALVDEATGYQNVREKDALQQIIDKFLKDEARKWSKTFPDEFWHKLIKVKGYPGYMALQRPAFVGHWVNDIIYSRLAPGVAKRLKEVNPRSEKGHRKNKHHQHLSSDHGVPELKTHLTRVMTLMDASSNDAEFKRLLNRSLPKYGNTLELDLS